MRIPHNGAIFSPLRRRPMNFILSSMTLVSFQGIAQDGHSYSVIVVRNRPP